jgi:hypothetical protein
MEGEKVKRAKGEGGRATFSFFSFSFPLLTSLPFNPLTLDAFYSDNKR